MKMITTNRDGHDNELNYEGKKITIKRDRHIEQTRPTGKYLPTPSLTHDISFFDSTAMENHVVNMIESAQHHHYAREHLFYFSLI